MIRWVLKYDGWERWPKVDAYATYLSIQRDGEHLGLVAGRISGPSLVALHRDHNLGTDDVVVRLAQSTAAWFEKCARAGRGPTSWQKDAILFDVDEKDLARVVPILSTIEELNEGQVVSDFVTD